MNHQRALLFDLNGTMIDDMPYHIKAWHEILNDMGAGLSYEQMKDQCYGRNDELLQRIFPGRFSAEEIHRISLAKEEAYQSAFRPHLKLIDGLPDFLEWAYARQMPMAIGSAAIMFNINFVIDNLHIRHFFDAIVSAEDVAHSKPSPETYLRCAEMLGVSTDACIVFEDAPKGVESAANAAMKSVVILGVHTPDEFKSYHNILQMVKDYNMLDYQRLQG